MTLQKLYEKLVLKTIDYARYDEHSRLHEFSKSLPQDLSFSEIGLRASLFGIEIPSKENFKKWGENYLIQCLYFLCDSDKKLLNEFFECLMNHQTTLKSMSDDFKSVCYDLYVNHICVDKDICIILSKYIVEHCIHCDFYDKFFTLANSTGLLSFEIDYGDFLKTKKGNRSEKH